MKPKSSKRVYFVPTGLMDIQHPSDGAYAHFTGSKGIWWQLATRFRWTVDLLQFADNAENIDYSWHIWNFVGKSWEQKFKMSLNKYLESAFYKRIFSNFKAIVSAY